MLPVGAALAAPGPKHRPHKKLDDALSASLERGDRGPRRVIVQTKPGKGRAVRQMLEARGEAVTGEHAAIGSLSVAVDAEDLAALANDPSVEHVSSDAVVSAFKKKKSKKSKKPPKPPSGNDGTLAVGRALLLTTLGVTKKDSDGSKDDNKADKVVRVAVIDSGIAESKELKAKRIHAFFDFTQGDQPVATAPYDDYGHGTHVAGVISNDGKVSGGIAKRIELVGLKVLDENGQGRTSDVLRAIQFAIEQRDAMRIRVINLSLGHPILEPAATDPLVQAVEAAVRAGIVVVVSAGNSGENPDTGQVGYAGITSPGNAPSAITVGALDTGQTSARGDDIVPAFSSRGPTWFDGYAKPDLVAPGTHLLGNSTKTSLLFTENPTLQIEAKVGKTLDSFLRLSGTSMATAVTSGVVALVIQANQREFCKGKNCGGSLGLTPNSVKAILQYTALPLDGYDALTQGAGGLNAAGALVLAIMLDPLVPEGEIRRTTMPTETTLIDGQELPWAKRLVWGDRVIWGDQIYVNDPAWDLRIVWGERLVWGDRMVWGESLVWSDVTGDRLVWGDLDDGAAGLTTVR